MSKDVSMPTLPSAFQPLVPEERVSAPLLELASEIITTSYRLHGVAGRVLPTALRPWLRAMNSYYTNKIEGQNTLPSDIERALHHQFAADAGLARKQRLALAHMESEEALEALAAEQDDPYAPSWVQEIHNDLYGRLPQEDRQTSQGALLAPGVWRDHGVQAGHHIAPEPEAVPGLMEAWGEGYRRLPGLEWRLIGLACAHHRLLWVHPFPDGNGRAARLHSHLALHRLGLLQGMWSPMRGLARRREEYDARLNNADLPRRNDQDGRGALSQEGLTAFAVFFLQVCLDQARFMEGMLDLPRFMERLRDQLLYLEANPWRVGSETSTIKIEALEPLHYLAMTGSMERGRFMTMTGLPDRTARRVLVGLIDAGLLTAATPRAPVTFAVPLKSLRFLFPRLWPEAESDTL
ncbi:MAG: hypothetical protein AUJ55_11395 [Proteobacteria bacterium CG1_02_64_396]|nr:MAG: hypothetical protein AUJ55_11395 [Proteobacteria bacterium CG1_02_64_396]